ncbi:hypothetical protein ABH923_000310 [Leifsonia sp. EB41]|uniref:hypothetical protein n=1 Tax=Leifsonia sp. EB41 TaxID=3156260 RepID=UPI003511AA14
MDEEESGPRVDDLAAESAALARLHAAIRRLGGDTTWILDCLAETIAAMKPIEKNGMSPEQQRVLVEMGEFTIEELDHARREVNRGSLKVSAIEAFLSHFYQTISLEDMAAYLRWDEAEVRRAVAEGRLCAAEIGGRLRFPVWQLSLPDPEKLLPGLQPLLQAASQRWDWSGLTAFMSTPQEGLVLEGQQTPAEWLRRGGAIKDVQQIIESWEWM